MESETERREMSRTSPRLRWVHVALVLVVLLVLLGGFIFYRIETWPQRTAAASVARLQQVGRDARDAFVRLAHLQPRVTVNNHVYLEQTSTVAELAVIARTVEVDHEMVQTWAGSTKRIRLHGTFLVKAGFDLRKKFVVNVQPDEITIELPHAEILSVEQQHVEVLALENGFWNRISSADLEKELAVLPSLAREKSATQAAEAEQVFTRELREKFHPPQPVRAIFPAPSPHG
jgi:hypothetical protein